MYQINYNSYQNYFMVKNCYHQTLHMYPLHGLLLKQYRTPPRMTCKVNMRTSLKMCQCLTDGPSEDKR
jgi:hypothetical protein